MIKGVDWLIGFGVAVLFSAALQAQDSPGGLHAGELTVALSKSQIVELDVPYKEAFVGDQKIADVLPLTDRSLYVLGRGLGSTNLTIYGPNKRLISVVDLVVTADMDGLKSRLYDLMPGENISVYPAGEAVVLEGTVSSTSALTRALQVADRYAPDAVVNFLSVNTSQQVMLEVRFSEVQRSLTKGFGADFTLIDDDADILFSSGSSVLDSVFGIVGFNSINIGDANIDLVFDALEDKGMIKTLAEPTLVAKSGDTASFLAGGEFPIPIAQAAGSNQNIVITIEFKEFGIGLSFTPTVLADGLINLEVVPEVSSIDPSTSVSLQGFSIPGLKTRRANTTVDLRDGESFAIAGLIQNDFRDTINQFPVLGDIPIIGSLFRSTNFRQSETELVIIVTPRLVHPVRAGTLAAPTDRFVAPSEFEMFMLGKSSISIEDLTPEERARLMLDGGSNVGLDGEFGHVLK